MYVPLIKASFPNAAVNETVLGSKSVYDVSLDGTSIGTTFLYPRDDVLFIVTGTDIELVDMAFAVLPQATRPETAHFDVRVAETRCPAYDCACLRRPRTPAPRTASIPRPKEDDR